MNNDILNVDAEINSSLDVSLLMTNCTGINYDFHPLFNHVFYFHIYIISATQKAFDCCLCFIFREIIFLCFREIIFLTQEDH